jgi:hypothetical protein
MKLIRYLTHIKTSDRLPPLPRGYSTEFEMRQVADDEATLMKISAIRSPQNVDTLKRRHGAQNARELIDVLPRKHRPRRGPRLLQLIRRIFGIAPYDPMRRIYFKHRKR